MTEPNDHAGADPVPGADPAVPAPAPAPGPGSEPPAQPWGAYAASASAPVGPRPTGATAANDPLRSVLAGIIAATLGASAWALLVAITNLELGIVAVVVGVGVGWAMKRFGGAASPGLAFTAAGLAAAGIYVGFLLASLFQGAHAIHGSVFDAYSLVGDVVPWSTFLTDSVGGIGWLFLAVGAYGAWRIVGQPRGR